MSQLRLFAPTITDSSQPGTCVLNYDCAFEYSYKMAITQNQQDSMINCRITPRDPAGMEPLNVEVGCNLADRRFHITNDGMVMLYAFACLNIPAGTANNCPVATHDSPIANDAKSEQTTTLNHNDVTLFNRFVEFMKFVSEHRN